MIGFTEVIRSVLGFQLGISWAVNFVMRSTPNSAADGLGINDQP